MVAWRRFWPAVLVALIPVGSADAYVIGGGKWGAPAYGTGASITWSLMDSGLESDAGLTVDPNTSLPPTYLRVVEGAFFAWSAVADLSFSRATDPGVDWLHPAADAVDIRIGLRPQDGRSGTLAHAYLPQASNGAAAGDIFLDSEEIWGVGGEAGFSLHRVLVHEIGHSIGLKHSGPGATMHAVYSEAWQAPQPDDIAGAQFLYGPPPHAAPSIVPAPATLPMLVGALVLLGLMRRRCRACDQ